jgi:hypothetical protein
MKKETIWLVFLTQIKKRKLNNYALNFRALVYLIKLNKKQKQSSFNIDHTITHDHKSYLLRRLFSIYVFVCFVLICYLRKRKE